MKNSASKEGFDGWDCLSRTQFYLHLPISDIILLDLVRHMVMRREFNMVMFALASQLF
jgi:hypothetical protein